MAWRKTVAISAEPWAGLVDMLCCSNSADVVAKVPVPMMQALAIGHFLHCDSGLFVAFSDQVPPWTGFLQAAHHKLKKDLCSKIRHAILISVPCYTHVEG